MCCVLGGRPLKVREISVGISKERTRYFHCARLLQDEFRICKLFTKQKQNKKNKAKRILQVLGPF